MIIFDVVRKLCIWTDYSPKTIFTKCNTSSVAKLWLADILLQKYSFRKCPSFLNFLEI